VTSTSAHLEPTPAGEGGGGTVLVVNPIKVDDPAALLERVARRSAELGMPVPRLVPTTPEDPGEGQARAAADAGASAVLVAGGDGTVRAAAQGLAHTGVPMGILPQGTGNLLARNLGIPQQDDEALEVALTGRDRTIDLGRLEDGMAFAVMAGTGFDALMMREAPEGLKAVLGWPAYIVGGARGLRRSHVHIRLRLDDGPEQTAVVRTLLVGNVGRLQAGLELLPGAEPDDGLLDVALVAPRRPRDWLVLIGRGLTGRHRPDHRLELHRARRVDVRIRGVQPRQVDGDLISEADALTVSVDPAAVVVRVPDDQPSDVPSDGPQDQPREEQR
jgi:diacylglycerol kinase family enzyme